MPKRFIACICLLTVLSVSSVHADPPFVPKNEDFSGMGWLEAFDALHQKVVREYALGRWKSIDWAVLRRTFRPRVASAVRDNDPIAYQLAVRQYLFSLRDGHVHAAMPGLTQALQARQNGSYGLSLVKLFNRRIIAFHIVPDGAAARAGIKTGAVISRWNRYPIAEAAQMVSLRWQLSDTALATSLLEELNRYKMLTRDRMGTRARVRFRNPGSKHFSAATLSVENDGFAGLLERDFLDSIPLEGDTVVYRLLPSGYGYILLRAEINVPAFMSGETDPDILFGGVLDDFRVAVQRALEDGVKGLVLDLRGNHGGGGGLAANISGFFHPQRQFYQRQQWYDTETRRFRTYTVDDYDREIGTLFIEPQTPQFTGNVVALISPSTISSGEGVSLGIKTAPDGIVMGFFGTYGSFGMVGDGTKLPLGIETAFPYGRAIDERGRVMLDSRGGAGGVLPDIQVRITEPRAVSYGAGTDVLLEEAEACLRNFADCRKQAGK